MSARPLMATLIFAGMYLAPLPVSARSPCPNLSGKFMLQGEDGQVHISMIQHGCERITIIRQSGYLGHITTERHVLKIDGKAQKDSPWLGGLRQAMTAAKFVGSELQVEIQTPGDLTETMVYSLNSDTNLLEGASTQSDRKSVPLVATRQK